MESYQVELHSSVGVPTLVQIRATGFHKTASHFHLMMGEIFQQHFETVECFTFGEN